MVTDTSLIVLVQQWATPVLNWLIDAVTFVCRLENYVLLFPILYWVYEKRFTVRLASLFMLSAYTNSAFKYAFATERPPQRLHRVSQPGYSFPSGHAQTTTTFLGYVALRVKRRWLYIFASLFVVLVSFSRIYLGVHYPIDVIGGLVIGLVLLGLYQFALANIRLEPGSRQWFLVTLAVSFFMFLNHPQGDGPMIAGLFLGFLWGYGVEQTCLDFKEQTLVWKQIIKVVLGFAGLFLLKLALDTIPVLDGIRGTLVTVVCYSVLGFWVSAGSPWLFQVLRLDSSKS
jgi:membrane-associated phospholipid phosphatase